MKHKLLSDKWLAFAGDDLKIIEAVIFGSVKSLMKELPRMHGSTEALKNEFRKRVVN